MNNKSQCDEQKPQCGNCLKLTKSCPGYRSTYHLDLHISGPSHQNLRPDFKSLLIKSHTSAISERVGLKIRCLQYPKEAPCNSGLLDHTKVSDDDSKLQQFFESQTSLATGTEGYTAECLGTEEPPELVISDKWHESDNSRPASPLLSPYLQQQQLLHIFIWSMTASHQNELSPALGTYRRWLPYLVPITGAHTLLDQSIRACTLAHLGRLQKSNVLVHEAQVHYSRAIRYLNHELQDQSRGLSSEALGSTILLSIFEMFMSDSNRSWIRHANGVGTLMELRGPQCHRTGVDREMFLAYRMTLVLQAIHTDQKTFLNEPEWRQLSNDVHRDIYRSGVFKDGEQSEIFEVGHLLFLETVKVCTLLYESKNITEMAQMRDENITTVMSRLVVSASSCRRTLKSLLQRLRTAIKAAGHEHHSRLTNDSVFPVQYDFVNLYVASLHTGLWSIMMRVNRLLMGLEQSRQRASQYHMENTEMAGECCRCVNYMATSSFLGPFFMLLALRVSLAVLDDPVQRAWIIEKLAELGHLKLAIAKDLSSELEIEDATACAQPGRTPDLALR